MASSMEEFIKIKEEEESAGAGSNYCEDCGRELPHYKVIVYRMSWYETDRCRRSHTDMYFAREVDTRWGQPNHLCRIEVISVPEGSWAHSSAVENSKKHMADEEWEDSLAEELLFNEDLEIRTIDMKKEKSPEEIMRFSSCGLKRD